MTTIHGNAHVNGAWLDLSQYSCSKVSLILKITQSFQIRCLKWQLGVPAGSASHGNSDVLPLGRDHSLKLTTSPLSLLPCSLPQHRYGDNERGTVAHDRGAGAASEVGKPRSSLRPSSAAGVSDLGLCVHHTIFMGI
ncbi:hypothetical protein KC19_4G200300 [Ceratodon purpureus]|uniref:Uncharacterized protein n=1 Tax=Ceratodon purpureus TaxID=3225 RepID=A0A8T0ID15_CERPU|nr:hypothetical protein KC19_4G200300 [Ceratodon purpureus]